jgi:hypothetical protein
MVSLTIGAGGIGERIVLAQGASIRQYCILAHGCPPPTMQTRLGASMILKLCFADFLCRFAVAFGAGCIDALLVLADYNIS